MNTDFSTLSHRDRQSLDVAKLYYQAKKSQQEVAQAMGLSRPTVSKLLQHAEQMGFVQIIINDPRDMQPELADLLKERYRLNEVRLAPTPITTDLDSLRAELGKVGARLLEDLVRDGDAIGVEWSYTIHAMAQALTKQNRKNIKVIQLRGADTQLKQNFNEANSINTICQAFQAVGEPLPLPAVFENLHTKNLVEQENNIRHVLESGKHCRIAVFTVGTPSRNSLLFTSGLFTPDEIDYLMQRSVGGICARFVDADGQICLPDLNNRTIGITLPDLRHKEERVLIAGGINKARAIHTTLKYGYANRLVTDQKTAEILIEKYR